jgi:hypothetical protein
MTEFTAFEIAAILRVGDEATAPMKRVLGLARDLEKEFARLKELGAGLFSGTGVNNFVRKLGEVDPALDRVTSQMQAMRDSTVAALGEMNAALGATNDLARALTDQLAEAAAAARAMRMPIPAAGGRGAGRGGGGAPIPFPSGGGMSTSMGVGLIAGGAAAYGAYEESKLRDFTARALFLSGQPLADMPHQKQFETLRKTMLDVYTLTGAPLEQIEEASLSVVKLMAGFPLEKRMEVLKTALTFGAQEASLNSNVSIPQGADALVGLLHMTGQYDPAQIAKLTPKIAALSTITNLPLSTVMRAASYSMPIAQANLGVDADQILLLMTAMQRAGITNSKSGTWLREAITKTVTDTFTLTKHGGAEQKLGLHELGLLDSAGKSTVIDQAGHLDLMKEMEILNQARQRLQGPEFLKSMRQAFGAQGSEGWAVLTEPQVIAQLPQLRNWMNQMPGGETYFNDRFGVSTFQQGKDTLAEFNRGLMDVGSKALPAVSDALKVFDGALHGLNFTLEHMGVPSGAAEQVSSWAALGGAGLLLSPKLRRALGWTFGKIFSEGSEAAAAEGATVDIAAATGASAVLGSVAISLGAIAAAGEGAQWALRHTLGDPHALKNEYAGPEGRKRFNQERGLTENSTLGERLWSFIKNQPYDLFGIGKPDDAWKMPSLIGSAHAATPATVAHAAAITTRAPLGTLTLVRQLEGSGDKAVSPAGAIGRYQIMPGTARQYGFDPARLIDPGYNATVAGAVLGDLQKRYRGDLDAMLVAYNAGPGRADKWLAGGRHLTGLPLETQKYLAHAHCLEQLAVAVTPNLTGGHTSAAPAEGVAGNAAEPGWISALAHAVTSAVKEGMHGVRVIMDGDDHGHIDTKSSSRKPPSSASMVDPRLGPLYPALP